jgi:hypothetical protein
MTSRGSDKSVRLGAAAAVGPGIIDA